MNHLPKSDKWNKKDSEDRKTMVPVSGVFFHCLANTMQRPVGFAVTQMMKLSR